MATSTQHSKKYVLDCQYIYRGFSGNGATNSQKLVEILTSRNSEELRLIRQTYHALYNQDLLHLLSNCLKNNKFARAAYLRLREPHERDAEIARGALFGGIVDVDTLTEIICTRPSTELRAVRQAFRALYNSNVEQDITLKTNGNLKELLVAVLNSSRIDGARVDMSMAMCDAKVLFEAIESGKSIDKKTIISLLSLRTTAQLNAILLCYKQLYGPEFSKSLKREKCGMFGKELCTIITCVQHPEKYFVKQLRRALKNGNIRDTLTRVIVTRSGISLKDINNAFTAKTGWSLESLVRSEFNSNDKTNGLVAEFLIALLKRC
ncbi:hypothetical protein MRB53_015356 [Persea americana]|uniref:Uncharacterized protein n=1 Tax=Persea americana TaxID=3435 RepID=A0ACC2KDE0_PERAE|nr:hypothetical protein MRB53_015356 [Persea americana]